MSADTGSHYIEKQAARDAEYLAAWEKLTPEELEAMAAAGVHGPHLGRLTKEQRRWLESRGLKATEDEGGGRESLGVSEDAASLYSNSMALAEYANMAEAVDGVPYEIAERFGIVIPEGSRKPFLEWFTERMRLEVQRENSLLLRRLIGFLLRPGNLRIRAHALAHAARLAMAMGIRSLRHSVEIIRAGGEEASAEGLRKMAWKWVQVLDLVPLEGAKPPEACEAYRQDKLSDKHWRKEKCTLENLAKKRKKP